jgi:hypothetical protein
MSSVQTIAPTNFAAVDPSKDISLEGAAGLYARYDKEAVQVIERICGASFKLLLDMKV